MLSHSSVFQKAAFSHRIPLMKSEVSHTMLPIAPPLVGWFQLHRRSLPFREDPTPYHIWVSEIMLQQTRMNAVLPYYARFMEALPDIPSLAAVSDDELRRIWQGLGYYSRAMNLKKAAQIVCRDYGGALPANYDRLLSLPGIGPYTAGAVASISFGIPVPAVDGNVLRVFARLYDDDGDITEPATRTRITDRVTETLPISDAGDFNQALMELGALVCTPQSPDCAHCPLSELCAGYKAGHAACLPKKAPKTFENFDFSLLKSRDLDRIRALPSLGAVYSHRNLAFIGPPGTGKTHLAQAFGYACCQHGMRAYFIKASELRDRFTAARRVGKTDSCLKSLVRPSCLIIDEIGHCEFDKENTRLFFDLIDRRYNKEGNFNMVFTSNKNPALWREDFNEDSTLLCALDRIFDEATVFKLRGESFRGKKLNTVSVQTGKVKAVELLADQQEE